MNINTTGAVTFISHSYAVAATGKQYITNNNIVTGFTKAGAGGSITCMTSSGASAAGAIVNHSNNSFNGINANGACTLTGISHSGGSPTLTSTGNSFQNWVPGAGAVTGISYGSFAGTSSVYSNTVYNLRDTAAAMIGMTIPATTSSANPLNVYNNTIAKLISNPTTAGTGGTVTGLTIANASTVVNVYGNTIDTLSTSLAASGTVTGLAVTGATATNVYKNKIYNLTTNTGSTANANGVVSGLQVSAGTTVNLYNNLISNLDALADTASNAVIGLNVTGGTTVNAYHNTIRVAATSTSGAFSTSGIYAAAAPALTLINNIVSNTSSFGTGKTVAYRRALGTAGTIPSGYSSTSNNNLFYAGTPGANNLIYLEGVIPTSGTANSQTTIKNYKTFMSSGAQPRDQSAVSENISFVSTDGLSADFLKYPLSGSQAEKAGTPVASVTDDYAGTARSTTLPDMGAWELAGAVLDVTGPSISYNKLGAQLCATGFTLSNVLITDAAGVNNGAGTKPRLYYKKSTAANTFNDNTSATDGWKYVEASNSSSPFSFTADYSLLNPIAAAGDSVYYFVVAQDSAATPNASYNNSAGTFAIDPTSVEVSSTNFPLTGTLNAFKINTALASAVTVGATGTYTTVTGAGGLFDAINTGGLSVNTTATIIDSRITEPGTISLNKVAYGCTGAVTLTIKPHAAGDTLYGGRSFGAATDADAATRTGTMIRFNGASNVIIDGSSNGTTSRDLVIQDTALTTPRVIGIGSIGVDTINYITVKNCVIRNNINSSATTSIAVVLSDTAFNAATSGYFKNITIQNNKIQKSARGIFVNAVEVGTNGQNVLIDGNILNDSTNASQIRVFPIYINGGLNGATISNNQIGNMSTALAEAVYGIIISTGVKNTTVSGNTIANITHTNGGAYQLLGIGINTGTATGSNNVISNNTISNMSSSNTSPVSGMYVFNGNNTTISGNTIYKLAQSGANGTTICGGIAIGSTATNTTTVTTSNVCMFVFVV